MAQLGNQDLGRDKLVSLCIRYNVPIHNADGLHQYFCQQILPGGFLRAVLTNNLKEACLAADETNRHHIPDLVNLLYNEAPVDRWGNEEKFFAWLSQPTGDPV